MMLLCGGLWDPSGCLFGTLKMAGRFKGTLGAWLNWCCVRTPPSVSAPAPPCKVDHVVPTNKMPTESADILHVLANFLSKHENSMLDAKEQYEQSVLECRLASVSTLHWPLHLRQSYHNSKNFSTTWSPHLKDIMAKYRLKDQWHL